MRKGFKSFNNSPEKILLIKLSILKSLIETSTFLKSIYIIALSSNIIHNLYDSFRKEKK